MKAIIAFYASSERGSEYRSGWEFIQFAAKRGFEVAIVADLEDNIRPGSEDAKRLGIKVIQISSPIRIQAQLYRWSDFWVQQLWHRRVADWIKNSASDLDVLWVQNGAQPWQPIKGYLGLSKHLVWGPVGGGAAPPADYLKKMPFLDALRERFRQHLQLQQLRRKAAQRENHLETKIVPIARTVEAQSLLAEALAVEKPPIIPEILWPFSAGPRRKRPSKSPTFIWVGQDLPRKNLKMAIKLFLRLKQDHFPDSTLEIFGMRQESSVDPSVTFHGWVSAIAWENFSASGVLLLTSYREGLPSVVLEALDAGLYCISTDTGSIGSLTSDRIYLLSMKNYPNVSDYDLHQLSNRLKDHLNKDNLPEEKISFEGILESYLKQEQVI